jgi:hypothetical protein
MLVINQNYVEMHGQKNIKKKCNQELIFLRASFIMELSKALMTLRRL